MLKCLDGSKVIGLKPDLVSRYAADSWAGVPQHALDNRSNNVHGEWVRLTFWFFRDFSGTVAEA